MTFLVDSNVLLDVATEDPAWSEWSTAALRRAMEVSVAVINPIIFAEVSVRYDSIEEMERTFPATLYRREHVPFEAAFLAGKAFFRYRRRGGARSSTLPDFFIGAHAMVARYRLLTRDPLRYRSYFPNIELIAP